MISSFESGVCVLTQSFTCVDSGRRKNTGRRGLNKTQRWVWSNMRVIESPIWCWEKDGERVSECTYSSSTGPNEREEKYSLSATCPSASPWSHAALQTHKHTLQQLLLHQIIMKKRFGGQTAYDLFKIQWGERAESERERESEPEMQFTAFLLLLLTFISHWF